MAELSAPLVITVHGTPAPQGSKRHVGNGRMVEMSKRVQPWRDAVTAAALAARGPGAPPLDGPLSVHVAFMLARPKGHYGTGRNAGTLRRSAPSWPAVTPDIDKLIRSTFDAISAARAWRDDAQVARVTAVKVYAGRDDIPGAVIDIRRMGRWP